jgi:hypothetical protein
MTNEVAPRNGRQQNKTLTPLVFLFLKRCLVLLTAIKDAENGYLVSIPSNAIKTRLR